MEPARDFVLKLLRFGHHGHQAQGAEQHNRNPFALTSAPSQWHRQWHCDIDAQLIGRLGHSGGQTLTFQFPD